MPIIKLVYKKTDGNYRLYLITQVKNLNYINYALDRRITVESNSGNASQARMMCYDLKTIEVNNLYKPVTEKK